jgi:hypothetical protein
MNFDVTNESGTMSHITEIDSIECLASHKCSEETHKLIDHRIRNIFKKHKVNLLRDKFDPGDDIDARIETFDIQALLFFFNPDSWASQYCRKELGAAERLSIPVFLIRLAGDVPMEYKRRIYLDLPTLDNNMFKYQMEELAVAIHTRGCLYRNINCLYELPVEKSYGVIKEIYDLTDRTVLAEFVDQLGEQFFQVDNPTTQFWIATTIGKAGTLKAKGVLEGLLKQDNHPYARYGVFQALEKINGQ